MYSIFIIISIFITNIQSLSNEAIQQHRKLQYRNWYATLSSVLDEENCHITERGSIYPILTDENEEVGKVQFITKIEGNRYTIDPMDLCLGDLLLKYEPSHDNLKTFTWSQVKADPIMLGEAASVPSSISSPSSVSYPKIDKPASSPNYVPNPTDAGPSPRDITTLTPFPSSVFAGNQYPASMNSTSNPSDMSLDAAWELSSSVSTVPSLSPTQSYNDQVKLASHNEPEESEQDDKMHPGVIAGVALLATAAIGGAAIGGASFATTNVANNGVNNTQNQNNQDNQDKDAEDDDGYSIPSIDRRNEDEERPPLIRQMSYRHLIRTQNVSFRSLPSDIELSSHSSEEHSELNEEIRDMHTMNRLLNDSQSSLNTDLIKFDDESCKSNDPLDLSSFLQLDHEMHSKIRDNGIPLQNTPIPEKPEVNLSSFLELDNQLHAKIRDNDIPLENEPTLRKIETENINEKSTPKKRESFTSRGPNVPDLAFFLKMGFLDPSFDDDSNVADLV